MEFSETSIASARKFLLEFCSKSAPSSGNVRNPLTTSWPTLASYELEGECLELVRSYLSQRGCPGILSYHIAAEAVNRMKALPQDLWLHTCPPSDDDTKEPAVPDTMLDGTLVTKSLVEVIQQVCSDWNNALPMLMCPLERTELSICGVKNGRRKMEDRYSLCVDLNSLYSLKGYPDQTMFAVYDGHIGPEAAVYCATHLPCNIVRHPSFQDDPITAIKDACHITDERFCSKNIRSGSTVALVLRRGNKLYSAWVGDSQAVLYKKGQVINLVTPHKPDREDEQQRIEAAGGMVIWMGAWRVNGNLSVSRAIGDGPDKKFVTGDPDVVCHELDGTEDYIVIACDGLWDVLNGEEVMRCVYKHLSSGGSKQGVAKALVEAACKEGSTDNITVVVIFFGGFQLLEPPPFEASDSDKCTGDNLVPNGGDNPVPNGGDNPVPNGGDNPVPNGGDNPVPNGGDNPVPNTSEHCSTEGV